jgi:hypothetical protein
VTTTASDTSATPPSPPPKKKRGREDATDMVRSLGLVLLVVIPLWFLAQPGRDAEQELRVVDSSADLDAWTENVPGAPVPAQLEGWRQTVSDYQRSPAGLRLGWNTPRDRYAEFAATTGPGEPFVEEIVGGMAPDGDVDVDGAAWRQYTEDDGSISLVREFDGVTVVVGTRRATAYLDELFELARTVAPSG